MPKLMNKISTGPQLAAGPVGPRLADVIHFTTVFVAISAHNAWLVLLRSRSFWSPEGPRDPGGRFRCLLRHVGLSVCSAVVRLRGL